MGTAYGQRPEISAALGGHTDQRTRHSSTLGQDLLATAVPIRSATRPPAVGAVRVTQSVAAVHRAVRRTIVGLVLIGAVASPSGSSPGWSSRARSRDRCAAWIVPRAAWRRGTSRRAPDRRQHRAARARTDLQ